MNTPSERWERKEENLLKANGLDFTEENRTEQKRTFTDKVEKENLKLSSDLHHVCYEEYVYPHARVCAHTYTHAHMYFKNIQHYEFNIHFSEC